MDAFEQGLSPYLVLLVWALHISLPIIAAAFWYRGKQIDRLERATRNYNIALRVSRGRRR
jgi:hypothetical protein